MTHEQLSFVQIAANAVGLLMILVSWRFRNLGRLFFVALFLWAAQLNLRMSIAHPEAYLEYGQLTPSPLYREFIVGLFAQYISGIVGSIAVGQFIIAILIALRGFAVRLGLIGAIVFLLSVAPLGLGSGFPATLFMALAAVLLLPTRFERSLPREAWLHIQNL